MNAHTTPLDQLRPKILFQSDPRKEVARVTAAWENFFKKENIAFRTDRKLHLPRTRNHNIAILFLLHFTFGSGIGRCHPSWNARLCREQGKLRTLSQNRHKKHHCRTFQYTRQGNIFSRLATANGAQKKLNQAQHGST